MNRKQQATLDDMQIAEAKMIAAHNKQTRALELETSKLVRDKAQTELAVAKIIEQHVVDVEKAQALSGWGSGGGSS